MAKQLAFRRWLAPAPPLRARWEARSLVHRAAAGRRAPAETASPPTQIPFDSCSVAPSRNWAELYSNPRATTTIASMFPTLESQKTVDSGSKRFPRTSPAVRTRRKRFPRTSPAVRAPGKRFPRTSPLVRTRRKRFLRPSPLVRTRRKRFPGPSPLVRTRRKRFPGPSPSVRGRRKRFPGTSPSVATRLEPAMRARTQIGKLYPLGFIHLHSTS